MSYKIVTSKGAYCGAKSTGLTLEKALKRTYSKLTPNSNGCSTPKTFHLVNEQTSVVEYIMDIKSEKFIKT